METMVAGDLWEQALQKIQSNLSSQTYEAWFRSLGPLEFDGSTLVLEVPSQFYVDWLDQHYRGLIARRRCRAIGRHRVPRASGRSSCV
jgi:chromosomal replication initiator protein